MTFEEILTQLRDAAKTTCESVFVVSGDTLNGEEINPYLMIRTKEKPALSQFMPTSCDVLADDWELVE